jgi:UDP-N-acetylmuramate: L-alanyl-gamma-D-glutamyl-meso-diaminopimelate ligase
MIVHLIGIAGTGMGAFAGLLKTAGMQVRGSDSAIYPPMSEKLADWGIEVRTPYDPKNLDPVPDYVIVGNVASATNVEAMATRERQLQAMSFPQALSEWFLKDRHPIVVAGTHGKTTTSALIAHTLMKAGRDPSYLIGGIPQEYAESFRLGKGESRFFVVEGDEYDTAYFDKGPKFLHYRPEYLLCTSLEYDHADIYDNVEQIIERFSQVMSLVPEHGHIIMHANSPHLATARLKANIRARVQTYGKGGDWTARDVSEDASGVHLTPQPPLPVGEGEKSLFLPLSGLHNVDNALGAYAILSKAGLSHDEIANGFASFKGVKRRMEEIGEEGGVLVIDDFAHHPTAVETTLAGAKKRYGSRPLWALFEPRSASSCRKVFQDAYAESFGAADRVILVPPGRELDKDVMLDVHQLARDIGARATAADSYDAMIEEVIRDVPKGAVLLCMSNGGFGNIHRRLLAALRGHPA